MPESGVSATITLRDGVAPFLAQAASLPAGPAWLVALRARGGEAFAERGLPTTREEAWRWTNVAPLARGGYQLAQAAAAAPATGLAAAALFEGDLESRLVFRDGHLAERQGSELFTRGLGQAWDEARPYLGGVADLAQPFTALSTALLSDGAAVLVPRGVVLERPIHLVFESSGAGHATLNAPRVLIVLGEGAQASVVESHVSDGGERFTNAVTEILLEPNAVLDHTRVQDEGAATTHIAATYARLDKASQLTSHVVSLGAALARLELAVELRGEGASCTLHGLYLAHLRQHVDCHTLVDHFSPQAGSNQLYKGVLDGSARGVFDGKVVVHPRAQKTDAHQRNKNLLLSREALADSKPQLEIYNNDVRCTHGSTTGQLDPDALFYLRSRGLSERQAKGLLTHAFASELLAKLRAPGLRAALETRLLSWLPGEDAEVTR